jgi:DNA-binding Xre family transcriptional regulator
MEESDMLVSNLTSMMEEKGVTVLGLADKAGVSTRTIMRARGPKISRCTLETLATIAGALGVKVKDLFDEG